VDALALSHEGRIVARRVGAVSAKGECGIERKSSLNRGPRLLQPAEMRQRGGELEMRERIISVQFDTATVPHDSVLVSTDQQLGDAREVHPGISEAIARAKPERFVNMALGFLGATKIKLGETNICVSGGQISIQRQRALAFGNAQGRAVGLDLSGT